MSYGLQYLNGFGESYNASFNKINPENYVQDTNESTNNLTKDYMDNEVYVSENAYCCKRCERTEKWLKYGGIFFIGCVAGQIIKKAFREDKRKKDKED